MVGDGETPYKRLENLFDPLRNVSNNISQELALRLYIMLESESSNMQVDSVPTSTAGAKPTSKLRDSCHACARSKVRCPKQKPSCSRCEERGIQCQYFSTRRPGRRSVNNKAQASPKSDKGNHDKILLSVSSVMPTPPNPSPTTPVDSNIPTAPISFERDGILDASDVFSTLLLGDRIMTSWQDDLGFKFSDICFTMPSTDNPFDVSPLLSGNIALDLTDTISSSLDATSSANSSSSLYSQLLPPSRASSIAPPVTQISSCGCLTISLDLLKTLCVTGVEDGGSQIQTPDLLAKNKHSIETVHSIMSCPSCSGDSFLFTIISMIILKIIEKYSVAARTECSSSTEDFTGLLTEERTPAQLVLSELHRVQRLANQLSTFKRPEDSIVDEGRDSAMAQLSPHTLEPVESDVRRSLRFLSAGIIRELRQR
ncbi:hypothetical protein TMatcc_003323 [Talaromyces marneffei ATCC 18224]